jgi:hypothetical protein
MNLNVKHISAYTWDSEDEVYNFSAIHYFSVIHFSVIPNFLKFVNIFNLHKFDFMLSQSLQNKGLLVV